MLVSKVHNIKIIASMAIKKGSGTFVCKIYECVKSAMSSAWMLFIHNKQAKGGGISHNTQKMLMIMYGINQVTIICQKVYPRA